MHDTTRIIWMHEPYLSEMLDKITQPNYFLIPPNLVTGKRKRSIIKSENLFNL